MKKIKALFALVVILAALCATGNAVHSSFCAGWDCGRSGQNAQGSNAQAGVNAAQTGGMGNQMTISVNNNYGVPSSPGSQTSMPAASYPAASQVTSPGYMEPSAPVYTDWTLEPAAVMALISGALNSRGMYCVPYADSYGTRMRFRLTDQLQGLLQEATMVGMQTPGQYKDFLAARGWTAVVLVDGGIAILSGENPQDGGVEHYTVTSVAISGGYNVQFMLPVWLVQNRSSGGYSASFSRPPTAAHVV